MANRPSRLEVSIPSASADGLFYGRYPFGNAPIVQALRGAALSNSIATASLASGAWNPPGPLTFSYRIGGQFTTNYSASFQAWIRKYIAAMVMGDPNDNWSSINGHTRQSVLSGCKSGASVIGGLKAFQYILADSVGSLGSMSVPYNHALSQNWPLYIGTGAGNTGISGAKLNNFFNSPAGADWCFNLTDLVPADGGGFMVMDYTAQWVCQNLLTLVGNNSSNLFDGLYWDNFTRFCPSGNASFDRTNNTESAQASPWPLHWRNGLYRAIQQYKAFFPAGLFLGNLSGALGGDGAGSFTTTQYYQPIAGNINGGLYEVAFGFPYSDYRSAGMTRFFQETDYRLLVAGAQNPKIVVLGAVYLTNNGQLPTAWNGSNLPTTYGNNWQGARFAIGMSLLRDRVYLCWAPDSGYDTETGLVSFDEFGGQAAQYPLGYLGFFLGAASSTPLFKGCYVGQWTNGISIVCPFGNGQQTITGTDLVNAGFTDLYKMRGVQNFSFNNAQPMVIGGVSQGNTVVLNADNQGDAVILMRVAQ